MRTFAAFLLTYLVLMLSFSIFLVEQEKKKVASEFGQFALMANQNIDKLISDYNDSDKQIIDNPALRQELIKPSLVFTGTGTEFALYSGDFELLFNTNDYWLCNYTEYSEGNKNYSAEGYINPQKWFSAEEVSELESYLYAEPQAKEVGDLSGYSLSLEGLWVDNEMVIPHKIEVVPMYASRFDENGQVNSSSGTHTGEIIYLNDYKNDRDLPYFKHSSIQPSIHPYFDRATQAQLREKVLDKEKLLSAIEQKTILSNERVSFLSYRYYQIMPYLNTINLLEDNSYYRDYWTVMARDVDLGARLFISLIYVWSSCLLIFIIVALILARQTNKTYQVRERLEIQRNELTDALAHDLKTPLSIISGYAQNLIENIHTEKREHYAANILTNVGRMDKIIQTMLNLSRLESDGWQINFADISLNEASSEIISRYQYICDENSVSVDLAGEALIKADVVLIEMVLDNFFVNALEHTPVGGIISINISDDTLVLYNSGSNIPEKYINEIWEPYIKLDLARSKTKGNGLGLAIARRILELQGFTYGVRNVAEGVIFWFKFG